MAEVTGFRNNALPYPVYGVPFGLVFPIFDTNGDLVSAASGLDSEVSLNCDVFSDCTNESVEIGSNGMYYLLLTNEETAGDVVSVIVKNATSGAKTTPMTLYPRKLVGLVSGTVASGASSTITLDSSASAVDDMYNGCLCVATIDSNVEARIIYNYVGSTKIASVNPTWNVQPDSDDDFSIFLPEGMQISTGSNITHVNEVATSSGVIDGNVVQVEGSATIDGIGIANLYTALVAMLCGKCTVTDNGTTRTLSFKKQDGSSESFTVTVEESGGARANTGSIS